MTAVDIKNKFHEIFPGQKPLFVRSPGRVNLIGEHTDYNDGFVLPAAIDKETVFAIAKNNTNECRLFSYDLNQEYSFQLGNLEKSDKGWPNYLMGVVEQLQKAGHHIGGFDLVFGSNIPIGAGLSSSAAIECAMASGLNELFSLGIGKLDLVRLAQKAENEFVGVKCGIMDQFASVFGLANQVIKLDCRSLAHEYYPFDLSDCKIVLCDTQVKHSLASSEYNKRRQECETGVSIISKYFPQVRALRDATMEMLESCRQELGDIVFRRCKHVIEENRRVEKACEALKRNDLIAFGIEMYHSHQSLSTDYQVSCEELDFLVNETKNDGDVLGARMMGGGFGGCTINLVKKDKVDAFSEKMASAYKSCMGVDLKIYVDSIADGTSVINF